MGSGAGHRSVDAGRRRTCREIAAELVIQKGALFTAIDMAKSKKKKSLKKKARAGRKSERLTVDLDLDVHRAMEAARQSFEESGNDILRRLLGIDGPQPPAESRRAKAGGSVDGGWSKLNRHGRTIFLPNGTRLRAAYAGKAVEGEIIAGMWVVAGHAYNSPSAALNSNVRTRDGNPVNLNGWRHWEVRVPGREIWIRLNRFEPDGG